MGKRKKLNQKGKKKVVNFIIKVCVLLIVVLIALNIIWGIVKKFKGNSSAEVSGDHVQVTSVADESIAGAKETEPQPSDEEMMDYISENKDLYPAELRKFCKTYPQTLKYVYEYPEKKDLSPEIDLSQEYVEGEVPLLIQWDERWGYASYGDGLIGTSGCGPTCLSMVYIGLTGDTALNPLRMCTFAQKNGYYEEGNGTSWSLMDEGARKLGIRSEIIALGEEEVKKELQKGHPVILSMSEGEFTTSGHFIVLAGMDGDKFIVNDPNSRENSEKLWSWDEFSDQVKNLWAFSVTKNSKLNTQ